MLHYFCLQCDIYAKQSCQLNNHLIIENTLRGFTVKEKPYYPNKPGTGIHKPSFISFNPQKQFTIKKEKTQKVIINKMPAFVI